MIKAKRFWQEVSVSAEGNIYNVKLDARTLMTPLKNVLSLPTKALAEKIAEEWRAVDGEIKPNDMPMTKCANSAIERIPGQRREIEAHLAAYIDSDLLCYRADAPAELSALQKEWDIWLEWAQSKGLSFHVTSGIMPVEQPAQNQKIALEWLAQFSHFQLVAVHDFITITGSFVLAMAVAEYAITPENAFELSQIDHNYQSSVWGVDEDDAKSVAYKKSELLDSFCFFEICT